MGARRANGADLELGKIIGARHGVVHETAGEQLAGFAVIHAVFHQCLPNALHQPAMHLALHNHRIDDGAKVVHRSELVHTRGAGGRVNFDLADVGACGKGEIGRVVKRRLVQARLQLVQRVVVWHVGGERHLAKSDFLVRALDGEFAVGKLDVGIARLHQMRGNFLRLGLDLVQRLHDRRTAHADRARAIRAHAKRHAAGVAMHHVHRFYRNAQTGCHHLCKRGLVALAVAVRAGEHRYAAGRVHAHFAAFKQTSARAQSAGNVARCDTTRFDVTGIAHAAQQTLGSACGFAHFKPGYIAQALRLGHAAVVVAHVVLQRHGRLVRPAGDEVALADFILGQPQVPAAAADQTLQKVGGFRPARTTVGIHRRGIGKPGVHLHINLRAGVLARQKRGVQNGGHGRCEGGQVGTHVGIGVHTHGEKFAVLVHRHFRVAHVVAAMRVGQERLGALARPLDAAVDLLGRPGEGHVFGIQENFGAKAAAHVGRNHAHLVLGQAQYKRGHQQALNVRVLVGHVQRVFLGGAAVHANGGARLHRVGHQAVVHQIQLGNVGSRGKSGVHIAFVANRPFVAVVVGRCLVQRCTFGGVTHVHDGGQYVVFNVHGFGGVFGLLQRFSNHHRHLVAYVADFAYCQNGVRRLFHRRAIGAGDEPAARQAAHFSVNVLAGENFDHAGHGFGFGQVDSFEGGMRVRAAHEHGKCLVGLDNVVGVVA